MKYVFEIHTVQWCHHECSDSGGLCWEFHVHVTHYVYDFSHISIYYIYYYIYEFLHVKYFTYVYHQRETLVEYSSRTNVFSWYYWDQAHFSGHFCSSVGRPAHIRIHQVVVCVYEYICLHRYTLVSTRVYLCMYICVHICIYSTFVSIWIYIYTCVYSCIYMSIGVRTRINIHLHTRVRMHAHIDIHIHMATTVESFAGQQTMYAGVWRIPPTHTPTHTDIKFWPTDAVNGNPTTGTLDAEGYIRSLALFFGQEERRRGRISCWSSVTHKTRANVPVFCSARKPKSNVFSAKEVFLRFKGVEWLNSFFTQLRFRCVYQPLKLRWLRSNSLCVTISKFRDLTVRFNRRRWSVLSGFVRRLSE